MAAAASGAIIAFLAAMPGAAAAEGTPLPRRAAPPNLVFILVDDLRWDLPGFMGNPVASTPHLDALAKNGTVFRNCFVTTSICCVSRASILTGQHMRRHGIRNFSDGLTPAQWSLTYPVLLRQHGYRSGFVGKFGVGDAAAVKEAEARFDFWRGEPGQGAPDFIDPADPARTHQTARLGGSMLEFVDSCSTGQPFCLSVSFTAVHARDGRPREFQPDLRDEALYADTPMPVPVTATEEDFRRLPEFVRKSEGRTRQQRRYATPEMAQRTIRDYYRLLTGVDREIGRLTETLQRNGLAENTVIVFTADNGFALGDRGLADKWFPWEEDIRVPALIYDPRAPAGQRGRTVSQLVLNLDFAPTLLDFAGIPVPARMQGASLLPLLENGTGNAGTGAAAVPVTWREAFFYEHTTLPKIIPPCEGMRTTRWKYIRWTAAVPPAEELYDLQTDPLERRNLAAEPAGTAPLEDLRARHARLGMEAR